MTRYFQFIGLIIILLAVSLPAAADFPLAYVGYSDNRDLTLSPDGKSVAVLKTDYVEGFSRYRDFDIIEFKSAETGEVYYTHDLEDRLYVWVSWHFDRVMLAQTIFYSGRGDSAKTSLGIVAIDPVAKTERILYQGPQSRWNAEKDAPKISAISSKTLEMALEVETKSGLQLKAINVFTGKSRLLDQGNKNTLRWELGSGLEPVLRFDSAGRGEEEVYFKDATGNWVLRRSYDAFTNRFRPVSRINDDKKMLVLHRPDDADRAGLYTYNFSSNAYEQKVFEHSTYDLVTTKRTSFYGKLLYVGWWEDQLEREWFDEASRAAAGRLDRALKPEDNWSILETSIDEKSWLIFVSSPTRPGSYMHYNLETKQVRSMARMRPSLKKINLSPVRRVNYNAQDGKPLFGYLTQSRLGSGAPLIVMPHGGPVARDHADYDGYAQFLAGRGYNVFQPQFRGGGGLGKAFEEAGHGQWGQKMQTDIEDGVAALTKQGLIETDSARSIFGFSYGGYAALAGATLTPDAYQCAISVSGVSHLPTMLNSYDRKDARDRNAYDIWVKRIGDPETDMDRIKAVSPSNNINAIKARVMLIHGTADEIVDVKQSRIMKAAMEAAGQTPEYLEIADAGHQFYNLDDRADLLVAVDFFLLRCMPPRVAAKVKTATP